MSLRKVALMGLLLAALANCGSRKSDGSPNASGNLYLYKAGTVQQEFGYADPGCTVPLTAPGGAIPLDGAGKRTVFVKAPADMVMTDSSGTPVDSIPAFNNHRAELVEVQNASYTGRVTDPGTGAVSQGLGGLTSLDSLLTSAALSLGPNFQYLLPGGVARPVQSWMKNVGVFAGDFGALFDGKTDDTVAIQKAINFVASLGGGKVLLPPGTAIIGTGGAGLTIPHGGTVLQGAGSDVTVLQNASGTANAITQSTTLTGTIYRGFAITAASTSTGVGIQATAFTGLILEDVKISGHDTSFKTSGGCDKLLISSNCKFIANTGVAGARAWSIADTTHMMAIGGIYSGSTTTYDVEFFGTCDVLTVIGASFSGAGSNSVRFDAAFGAAGVKFIGNKSLSTAFWSFGNASDPSDFYQYGNGALADSYLIGILSGATGTPDRSKGDRVKFDGTTTGSAFVIAAPTPTPTRAGTRLTIQFYNHAGGAITGWTLNAVFKSTASIPTTDAHIITVIWEWDSQTSSWREVSRADTAV